jgi:hypothetical protein
MATIVPSTPRSKFKKTRAQTPREARPQTFRIDRLPAMNENILWNDRRASLDSLYSWSRAHKTYKNIQYGRRRSGKRWFWAATQILNPETEKFGWADTEHQALVAAGMAVIEIAGGKPASVSFSADPAAHKLRELNEAKRAARPGRSAKGSGPVELLYNDRGDPFPIIKKTHARVYYIRSHDPEGRPRTGFVNRRELEERREVYVKSRLSRSDWRLFLFPPAKPEPAPNRTQPGPTAAELAALKLAMADAHPDRGGSSEAFIVARARYLRAKMAAGKK